MLRLEGIVRLARACRLICRRIRLAGELRVTPPDPQGSTDMPTTVPDGEFARSLVREIPRLRRYARTLAPDAERADDLVQDCLTRALAKEHLWQPGTELRAWLFTMLHNLSVSIVRRLKREEAHFEWAIELLTPLPHWPDARLEILDLHRQFGRLPLYQREVLQLIGVQGASYEKAGEALGVPAGTVRSRLGRARKALRVELNRPQIRYRTPPQSGICSPAPNQTAPTRDAQLVMAQSTDGDISRITL